MQSLAFESRGEQWVCFIVGVLAPDLGNREAWDSTLRREERGREEQKRREKREEEKRVEREERGRIFTPGREKEERGRQRGKTREGSRLRKCKRLQTKARGGDERVKECSLNILELRVLKI